MNRVFFFLARFAAPSPPRAACFPATPRVCAWRLQLRTRKKKKNVIEEAELVDMRPSGVARHEVESPVEEPREVVLDQPSKVMTMKPLFSNCFASNRFYLSFPFAPQSPGDTSRWKISSYETGLVSAAHPHPHPHRTYHGVRVSGRWCCRVLSFFFKPLSDVAPSAHVRLLSVLHMSSVPPLSFISTLKVAVHRTFDYACIAHEFFLPPLFFSLSLCP